MVQWSNACAPTFPLSSAIKCLKCGDVVCGHELLQGLPIQASKNLQEVLAHSRGENRCTLEEGHEKHHGPMARWGNSLLRHLGRKMAEWNTVDRLQPVDELDVHTFGQEVLWRVNQANVEVQPDPSITGRGMEEGEDEGQEEGGGGPTAHPVERA